MTHVRNLIKDLVERKLWPVALVLAVALAAVPVVLGRTGGDAATDTAALPAAPATDADGGAEKAAVTVDTSAPATIERGGRRRNPFKAPGAAAGDTTTTASPGATSTPASVPSTGSSSTGGSSASAGTASGSAGSSSASAGSPSSSGSIGSTTPTTTTTPKPKTTTTAKPKADDATDTYHVSLRFGVNGSDLRTIKDVARLRPIPSVTDPFFVFLGVLQPTKTKAKRAVFLVSSDATPTGDGACHPTQDDCETVELAKGETMFFDYTAPDGTKTQYQLELAGIHKTAVASAAKAQAAIARHSAAGQELVRDAATRNVRFAAGARAYRYVAASGLLVRAKRRHVTARAAAAGLVPGLALLDGEDQPGIPVWHAPTR